MARCPPHYMSFHYDENAVAIDAFNHSWQNFNLPYIFCPFSVIDPQSAAMTTTGENTSPDGGPTVANSGMVCDMGEGVCQRSDLPATNTRPPHHAGHTQATVTHCATKSACYMCCYLPAVIQRHLSTFVHRASLIAPILKRNALIQAIKGLSVVCCAKMLGYFCTTVFTELHKLVYSEGDHAQ